MNKRDRYTEKLGKIVANLEHPETGVTPRALYVFGSYARGALNPHDLDLIAYIDFSREWIKPYLKGDWRTFAAITVNQRRVVVGTMRGIDLLLNIDVHPEDNWNPILVWSPEHPNWRQNLATINPDPNAKRFARDHFYPLKLTRTNKGTMERTMRLIHDGALKLDLVPITDRQLRRGHKLSRDLHNNLGHNSAILYPAVEDWMKTESPEFHEYRDIELHGETACARIGKIDLCQALYQLADPRIEKVCLAPHLRTDQPRVLYILTRLHGPLTHEQTDPMIE